MDNSLKTFKWYPLSLVIIFLLFSSINIYGQKVSVTIKKGKQVQFSSQQKKSFLITTKDGNVTTFMNMSEDPQKSVRIIITFKDPPLRVIHGKDLMQKRQSLNAVYSSLQETHNFFRTALNNLKHQINVQSKYTYNYKILRDYYRAINGVALECNEGMINRIRTLPMVKSISSDEKIKAYLKQSIHQIHADKVQDSLGYKGKGVLIGEIDTGIDYNNPALGGGFGPGYRITEGYDFANNDNDPMDDHGHGTHVAGIIGANGGDSLQGVAPEVKFAAVKVLDANGSGWISTIIEGIEYCIDPDSNPSTDDAVDIINMSLGGAPTPDNPLDSAVSNATKAGILSVIAAGNSGESGYGSIGSPGTSESALTVGACDSADHVTFFSSIGPDDVHSLIKPEVVAPGMNILSTILNNGTASWSGTSMAAPHVTGEAALLKEEHPEWSPEDLKAAIVNSAVPTGNNISPFVQGNGRIDAFNAATLGILVEPSVFNFGYADLALNIWKDTIQFKVKNLRKTSQHFQLNIDSGLPAGADLQLSQSNFVLSSLEEKTVSAILSVPASVPIVNDEPFAYTGSIKCISDSDRINIPLSFFKSATLVISCDASPGLLLIADRKTGFTKPIYGGPGATKYFAAVPSDNSMEIFAWFELDTLNTIRNYFIDHKNVNSTGITNVSLSYKEAAIKLLADPIYDINNNAVNIDTSWSPVITSLNVLNSETGRGIGIIYFDYIIPSYKQLFFSPLDSAFFVSQALAIPGDSTIIGLAKYWNGIAYQEDVKIPSGSNNLTEFNLSCAYNNSLNNSKKIGLNFKSWRNPIPGGEEYFEDYFNLPYYKNEKCFLNKQKIENDPSKYNSAYISVEDKEPDSVRIRTPEFICNENGEANVVQKKITYSNAGNPNQSTAYTFEIIKPGGTFHIENNTFINLPDFKTYESSGYLYMVSNDNGSVFPPLTNDGGTRQSNGVYEENDIISNSSFRPRFTVQAFSHNRLQTKTSLDGINTYYLFDDVEDNAGTYQILTAGQPYTILGQPGQCSVNFEYQVPGWPITATSYKYSFPSVNLLQVSVDSTAVNWVRSDQNGKIRLVLFDPSNYVTSVNISLLLNSGEEISIPASLFNNNEYVASIPSNLPQGFIDVDAKVTDKKGDNFDITASPAFYFGSNLDNINFNARLRMATYKLNNVDSIEFNSSDTLNYIFSYTNFGNITARDIEVTFPATTYFTPAKNKIYTVDSLSAGDTIQVPVKLIFLGKQQSTDKFAYYEPIISWNSNGTDFLRKQKILVDFQGITTNITEANNSIPDRFKLYQNYPNPFNPVTTIKYDLPKTENVSLIIYNVLGQQVKTLLNETKPAGSYTISWDGRTENSTAATGIYFLRMNAGDYSKTLKMILLK